MNIAKYKFDSKYQFKKKLNALNSIKHEKPIILGHIVESEATFNELGEILKEQVISTTYHVDMAWHELSDHPLGWKMHYENVDGNGLSGIAGLNYNDYKF